MSKLLSEIEDKHTAYSGVDGAQELIDAHLDDVAGGGYESFAQFTQYSQSGTPPTDPKVEK